MNWIILSILLFISSNVLYLLVRKGQKESTDKILLNFAMFSVSGLFFFIYLLLFGISFYIPLNLFILIIFTSFFCSYLGNVCSLKSIEMSPNPGYSLIISKSYVVFTSIVAVLLFHSKLSFKDVAAIVFIIGFSSLIIVGKSLKNKNYNKNWILFSLGAFFAWGALALISKYIISQGVNIFLYLFYLSIFVTLFIFIESQIKKVKISFRKNDLMPIFTIGAAATFFNLFMQFGYRYAPNPGYINAVNASSISLLSLLSAYFFKDELNLKKIVGIIGVTVGLILLFI